MKFQNNTNKTFKQLIIEHFNVTEEYYEKYKNCTLDEFVKNI